MILKSGKVHIKSVKSIIRDATSGKTRSSTLAETNDHDTTGTHQLQFVHPVPVPMHHHQVDLAHHEVDVSKCDHQIAKNIPSSQLSPTHHFHDTAPKLQQARTRIGGHPAGFTASVSCGATSCVKVLSNPHSHAAMWRSGPCDRSLKIRRQAQVTEQCGNCRSGNRGGGCKIKGKAKELAFAMAIAAMASMAMAMAMATALQSLSHADLHAPQGQRRTRPPTRKAADAQSLI